MLKRFTWITKAVGNHGRSSQEETWWFMESLSESRGEEEAFEGRGWRREHKGISWFHGTSIIWKRRWIMMKNHDVFSLLQTATPGTLAAWWRAGPVNPATGFSPITTVTCPSSLLPHLWPFGPAQSNLPQTQAPYPSVQPALLLLLCFGSLWHHHSASQVRSVAWISPSTVCIQQNLWVLPILLPKSF